MRYSDFVSSMGDGAATTMRFLTKPLNSNPAVAMVIDNSQNVGIGTTSPDAKLEVSGSTNSDLFSLEGAGSNFKLLAESGDASSGNVMAYRLSLDYLAGTATNGFIDFYRGGDGGSGFLTFGTSGAEKMRIDSSGNVGIGTTSPAVDLHVLDTGGHSQLRIETDNAGSGAYLELESTTNKYQIYNVGGDLGIDESGVATRLTIKDSTGNVGIGTTSPSTKLHISSGATDEVLRLEGTGSPYFSVYDSGTRQFFLQSAGNTVNFYAENDNTIAFFTSGTRALDIDSSQNVGIGTSSPQKNLDITKAGTATFMMKGTGTDNYAGSQLSLFAGTTSDVFNSVMFAMDRRTDGVGGIYLQRRDSSHAFKGTLFSYLDVQGWTFSTASSTTATSTNERMTIENDGDIRLKTPDDKRVYFGVNNSASFRASSAGYNLLDSSDGNFYIRNTVSNQNIYFGINDGGSTIYPMTIRGLNSSIGFGTTTPSHKVHIDSAGDTNSVLRIDADDARGSNRYALDVQDDDGNRRGTARFRHTSGSGNPPIIISEGYDHAYIFQSKNTSASDAEQFRIEHFDGNVRINSLRGTLALQNTGGGNIGVGTTVPGALFTVKKDGTQASSVSTTYQIQTVSASNGGMAIQAGGTSSAYLVFGDNADYDAGRIQYNNSNNQMSFWTNNAKHMSITSAGKVLIGGTSVSGHNFNFEVLDDHAYVQGPDGWNGTGDKAIVALGSGVSNESFGCGYVYGTGLVLSTYKLSGGGDFGSSTQNSLVIADTTGQASFINDVIAYASSDKRLKENVKPLDNALDKINKINGVEFDWIDGKDEHGNSVHSNEGHDVGVIAQEIEEVLPEVVHTRDNGYKAVKYEKIVPLLIEAIKEQQEQINKLEEKLNG
jgi:hypothetical protein